LSWTTSSLSDASSFVLDSFALTSAIRATRLLFLSLSRLMLEEDEMIKGYVCVVLFALFVVVWLIDVVLKSMRVSECEGVLFVVFVSFGKNHLGSLTGM
jgi:hypothetical protein